MSDRASRINSGDLTGTKEPGNLKLTTTNSAGKVVTGKLTYGKVA